MYLENFSQFGGFLVEQEERDAYVKRYGEDALRRRDIHARFAVFASERLGGPQGEKWGEFLEMLMKFEKLSDTFIINFKKFLPKSDALVVWRTVYLVPEADPRMTFVTAIEMAGMKVSDQVRDILGNPAFPVVTEETEVKLVMITVAELGFPNGATRQQIYARAEELGLGLCPAEVGPQLRLQYANQPTHEHLLVGMEPITGSDGRLSVFRVWYDAFAFRRLDHYDGNADSIWGGDRRWLFVYRNPACQ